MFKSNQNKGFSMTFDNGYTVSVQWGPHNYCEHHNRMIGADDGRSAFDPMKQANGMWPANDAEVAAWDQDEKWVKLSNNDDVIGHQTTEEVLAILNKIAALPNCY